MKLPKETGKNIRVKSSQPPRHLRIRRGGAAGKGTIGKTGNRKRKGK